MFEKKQIFLKSFIAAAIYGAISSVPVLAQQSDAQGQARTSIEEIVVTARRKEEVLAEIPLSITAFSAEQLERKSINDIGDLKKIAPGLNISPAGDKTNPIVVIRGQARSLAGAGTPGTLIYFNDVPLPPTSSLISTLDVSNIQVLKGPQGTLFGRSAVGGAVLTYSQVPVYDFEGSAKVDYSRFNTINTELVINVPVMEDKLAVRVAGLYGNTDGYTNTRRFDSFQSSATGSVPGSPGPEMSARRDYDEYDSRGIRLSVLFDPVEAISSLTVYDEFRSEGASNAVMTEITPAIWNLPPAVQIAALGPQLGQHLANIFHCPASAPTYPFCNVQAYSDWQKDKGVRHAGMSTNTDAYSYIRGLSNNTSIELTDSMTLRNIVAYRDTDTRSVADIDGTPLPIIDTVSEVRIKQLTEELQLAGEFFDSRLNYVVGGFYLKSEPDGLGGLRGLGVNTFAGLNSQLTGNYLTETSKALYGQFDYDLTDALTLTMGYRKSWDESKGCAFGGQYSPFGPFQPANSIDHLVTESECKRGATIAGPVSQQTFSSSAKSEADTYTLALSWQATENALIYGTARKGYRAAGFNVPQLPDYLSDVQTFNPETVEDVEVGGKFSFAIADMPTTVDIAIFRGKNKGHQFYEGTTGITDPNGNSLPSGGIMYNKADIIIEGYEIAATLSPLDGLVLGLNGAYTDIIVDELTIPDSMRFAFSASGADIETVNIPMSPKSQINANLNYAFPGAVLGGILDFNADYHWQEKAFVNNITIPGYESLDMRFTLSDVLGNPVDLSLYATNVLDKEYPYGSSSSGGTAGVISYYFAAPRVVGASIRYRFGE